MGDKFFEDLSKLPLKKTEMDEIMGNLESKYKNESMGALSHQNQQLEMQCNKIIHLYLC